MNRLSEVLKDPQASGVYLLDKSPISDEVRKLAESGGLAFFYLDGNDIRTKDNFLNKAALALRFPGYFGLNWDAFADCLTDMSWHGAAGFLILYDNIDGLATNSPAEFQTAIDVFRESTEFWRDENKAMFVLLSGKASQADEIPIICV